MSGRRSSPPPGPRAGSWSRLTSRRPAEDGEGTRIRFNDLGNLLLMYVLVWAYLAYTQYLVIWSENLPHEIHWYVPPELHEFDTQATAAPEALRDAMAASGGILGGAENRKAP